VDLSASTISFSKAGKPVGAEKTVISKDGKVVTQTRHFMDASGQPALNVLVWEKQ
jgi:hypothetical protein